MANTPAKKGQEDPSVQIRAYLGSMFGKGLRLSDDRMRTLVAAGAAWGCGGYGSLFGMIVFLGTSYLAYCASVCRAYVGRYCHSTFDLPQPGQLMTICS